MAHNVLVNVDNVVVGGAEHDTGAVVKVSNDEFVALTAAGAFSGGSPMLTDQGVAAPAGGDDTVYNKGTAPAAVAALTSAVAVGGTPTKAEYDALRTDLVNTRTTLAALQAALTGTGKPL